MNGNIIDVLTNVDQIKSMHGSTTQGSNNRLVP